jgi:hypothetical protein
VQVTLAPVELSFTQSRLAPELAYLKAFTQVCVWGGSGLLGTGIELQGLRCPGLELKPPWWAFDAQ